MKKKFVWFGVLFVLLALVLAACDAPAESATRSGAQASAPSVTVQGSLTTAVVTQTQAQPALESSDVLTALQDRLEQIYNRVNPSVVNIVVVTSGGGQSDLLPQFPNFQVPQQEASGSGFVWDKQGHIVTNNHVVKDATDITVTFYDGTSVKATVVGQDADSDLAVIKVDVSAGLLQPVLVGDSTQARVGQLVVAIGNPFGELPGTQTVGFISAIGRSLPASVDSATGYYYRIPSIIQTDAPINPGNSGGVLVDDQGRLLGVTSDIASSDGQSAGIGFAVPSSIVQKVVPSLIEKGSYDHPWIGISGRTLTADMAKAMGLGQTQRGGLVFSVTRGSPAEKAGLQGSNKTVDVNGVQTEVGGDVIVAIGGQPVKEFDDIIAYLAESTNAGDTVTLTVLRDGKQQEISLTLGVRPTSGQSTSETQRSQGNQGQGNQGTGTGAYLGIQGMTVTSDIAGAMDLSTDQQGVLVENVVTGSPADQAGLRGSYKSATVGGQQIMVGGDVIVAIDRQAVTSMQDLQGFLGTANPGQNVTLALLRDGNQIMLDVTLGKKSANP